MSERKRIGYIHEFHPNLDHKDWVADQDMSSEDPVVKKVVQDWLYGLANPWSETSLHYVVHPNHAPANKFNVGEEWVAEYTSIFYDCLESIAIGYGSSPQEAIDNVANMVAELIAKYYECDQKDYNIEQDIADGCFSAVAIKILRYMWLKKEKVPQPILGKEIAVIAKHIKGDTGAVELGLKELASTYLINRMFAAGAVKYNLTPVGIAYCKERFGSNN